MMVVEGFIRVSWIYSKNLGLPYFCSFNYGLQQEEDRTGGLGNSTLVEAEFKLSEQKGFGNRILL